MKFVTFEDVKLKDQDEALVIAKKNPEFSFIKGAKIEVRPVKMKEQSTNFISLPGSRIDRLSGR